MSIFQFPTLRVSYPGVGNPRFVSDITAANEMVLDALRTIMDVKPGDFFILSGLDYTAGSPGTYDPGVVYMGNNFYYIPFQFSEGVYLIPQPQNIEPQPFDDLSVRNTYNAQLGTTTAINAGFTPVFSGPMVSSRLNLRLISLTLAALGAQFGLLGNSAFRNVGNVSGSVAAGDDPRFGYTQAQIDALFAKKIQVLLFGNTTPFTPILDYEPATKKYVDNAGGMKLRWCGTISGDASAVTRQAGDLTVTAAHMSTGRYLLNHNMGSANYYVTGIGYSSTAAFVSPRVIENLNASNFTVNCSDDASPNDWPFQVQIIQFFP